MTSVLSFPATSRRSIALPVIHGVVVLSGLAGLGYQMVWSRMLAVSLGHEIPAVFAVIAAFFVGLAIGSLLINHRISRAKYPARWYCVIELIIAVWSLLLIWLIPLFNSSVPVLIGTEPAFLWQWGVTFAATMVLLLPATLAMGATLPALERFIISRFKEPQVLPSLYAWNTLGAVVGTLLTTFVLIRYWGITSTLVVLAACNFLCAGVVLLYSRTVNSAGIYGDSPKPKLNSYLAFLLFACGLFGIGFEVIMVRLLSQILENTVYTYAALLAVYLLATVFGASLYRRWQTLILGLRWQRILQYLIVGVFSAGLLSVVLLQVSSSIYQWLWLSLGYNLTAAVLGEIAVAATVFLLPGICMGALFCHLACIAAPRMGFGRVLFINTLGAALAPLLWGVVLLPMVGAKYTIIFLLAGYLGLLFPVFNRERRILLACSIVLLGFAFLPLNYRFINLGSKDSLLFYRDGIMAAISVIEESNGARHLKVNNHFTMGGTASRLSDHRQSHIPLLLHGAPQRVLYLGLGSGVTFEAAQYYPGAEVVGVDLVPEVLSSLSYFIDPPASPAWGKTPRLLAADARRFVLADTERYDVIIGEIFHPSRDGAGSLYTREHFTAVKDRLDENGLFCQWLPLFQLDLNNLKTIVRTFLDVFPGAQLYLGHLSLTQPILCLLGGDRPVRPKSNWLASHVKARDLQQELIRTRLNSDFALFGALIGEGKALRAFAGEGPLNSDNFPRVNYQAPYFVYSDATPPSERLLQLLNAFELTENPQIAETDFAKQLNLYKRARNEFLRIGVQYPPGDNLESWARLVTEPLLGVVTTSAEFTPAYRTLLTLAQSVFPHDQRLCFEILKGLDTAAPQFPEARQLALRLLRGLP